MHKLPTALKCYDITNELQTTIDSKFTAIEWALSTEFIDHEAKFIKIIEDKLVDHEIKLNKKLSKLAEGINLVSANHYRQGCSQT